MKGICVQSEIGPLKKVLLHRPGRELLKLTPKRLGELLFDDIPYLKDAQREHDAFAAILRENGVEVVYLEDLMSEVLAAHTELVRPFLYQWLAEGNIKTGKWRDRLCDYLLENYSGKALVEKTMEGIALKEMGGASACSLQDLIAPADDVIVDPMPNLYFTRDPFASVGRGVFVNRMRFPTRRRETIYADYILNYHPDFAGRVTRYSERDGFAPLEGGDLLNLTADTIAIGISERGFRTHVGGEFDKPLDATTCIHCGQAIESEEIKRQARGESTHGTWADRLYCVVGVREQPKLDKDGAPMTYASGPDKGRVRTEKVTFFREPTERDLEALKKAEAALKANWSHWEEMDLIPTERIPEGHKTAEPLRLGIERRDYDNVL